MGHPLRSDSVIGKRGIGDRHHWNAQVDRGALCHRRRRLVRDGLAHQRSFCRAACRVGRGAPRDTVPLAEVFASLTRAGHGRHTDIAEHLIRRWIEVFYRVEEARAGSYSRPTDAR